MVGREARMSDVQIVSTLIRSCSLFSSMSILVLAGIFTVLGSLEKARELMGEWAFAVDASRALRQYRLGLLMTGAAPNPEDTDATLRAAYGERAAQVISRGVGTFNRGIRPYYFGLAGAVLVRAALAVGGGLPGGGRGALPAVLEPAAKGPMFAACLILT